MKRLQAIATQSLACFYASNKEKLWHKLRQSLALQDDTECLNRLLIHNSVTFEVIQRYVSEIQHAKFIRERVEHYLEKHKEATWGWSWEQRLSGKQFSRILFLYLLLRLLKPEKVIETGCFSGWTSTLILFALYQNNRGHLYTIDLPAQVGCGSMKVSLHPELSPGFLVPDPLRSRWTLILGDVKDHLLPLCHELGVIDVFYHDSDHTYEHMMWEYTCAWPHLKTGGVLISDDIGTNTAFWDFSLAMRCQMVISKRNINFGAICKG